MEPNKQSSNSQPVMDVQNPSRGPNDAPQVIQPNNNSLGRPATMEYTRPRPENPQNDNPSSGFSSPTTHVPSPEPSKVPEKPKAKKSKKIVATMLIIIGLLGTIGAAAFFYITYQNEEPTPAAGG